MTAHAHPLPVEVQHHHHRQRLLDAALSAALAHASWLKAYGPTSWDQYDLWASPVGRRGKSRVLPAQMARPARQSLLSLSSMTSFPAADGCFGIASASRLPMPITPWASLSWRRYTGRAGRASPKRSKTALLEQRCANETDYCWGYPFDWETCFGTWQAGTPLITSTPYAYEAFEASYRRPVRRRISRSWSPSPASRRSGSHRRGFAGRQGVRYSPMITEGGECQRVPRLSACSCRLAFRPSGLASEARCYADVRPVEPTPDGSWLYAMDGKDAFVDNFHTCFVLKNLCKARQRASATTHCATAIDSGYAFYKAHLLDESGLPVPFARAQRPHAPAPRTLRLRGGHQSGRSPCRRRSATLGASRARCSTSC